MLADLLLIAHIAAGALGLAIGPATLWLAWQGHPGGTAEAAYHSTVLAVSLTAVALLALDWPELWWVSILAALTYALALLGHLAARRRFRGWPRAYAHGQGGALVALVTALLVVSVSGSVVAWIAPTLVGLPLIERLHRRVRSLHASPVAS